MLQEDVSLKRVFACGFNKMMVHHITMAICVTVCLKLMLESGFVSNLKLQFPGLHAHLT
jgi:hypothetical protein